jgi:hypothetical protein
VQQFDDTVVEVDLEGDGVGSVYSALFGAGREMAGVQ